MDKRTFKQRAEQSFRRANPDAEARITWQRCELVTWADGSKGYSGSILVEAPGYRSRTMLASSLGSGVMVR